MDTLNISQNVFQGRDQGQERLFFLDLDLDLFLKS